ncbi:MAG: cysteine hydrolase [Deltaproteobacteria bacterium]|nr:cysteine hydrolase [Deltaproteobacteria bacterium]MBW2019990.1 cysteine hydrolase [Deltaproteobacteria bacterium]MBW2075051.1 cysteine hydrolase [Deltaproteobacteria bacterium]RLB84030.1 MAG: cysteine hydrolase [Deltaproteobacteria bacterium]
MSEKALIVVDMLNDFVDEKGVLYCGQAARDIIPFIQARLEACRKSGDLVIYLQDSHTEDDKEFEKFPKHAVTGTWGHQIIPELAPQQGDIVIQKRRYSGFFETELSDLLKKHNIQEVEVVGVCTNICVMDTVGGLANRDYNITVPRGGVADFDPEFHAFALKRMDKIYGAKIV